MREIERRRKLEVEGKKKTGGKKRKRLEIKLTTSLVPLDAPSFRVRSLTKKPGGRVIPEAVERGREREREEWREKEKREKKEGRERKKRSRELFFLGTRERKKKTVAPETDVSSF